MTTPGVRVYERMPAEPGEYGWHNSQFWLRPPKEGVGLGRLDPAKHTIEEHDDGTVTVSPSIGFHGSAGAGWAYHGWLRRGEWSEA